MKKTIDSKDFPALLLRFGLIFVFSYAAISSLLHPDVWVGFLPNFLSQHISAYTLLKIFAVYELLLVAWLLSGRKIKYAAAVCAITFAGIIGANLSQLITTFRDVGLLFMAISLYLLEEKD